MESCDFSHALKAFENKNNEKTHGDFQKISRKTFLIKARFPFLAFVPNCSGYEICWDTSIIEKCDYYTTEMPYQDPMFLV